MKTDIIYIGTAIVDTIIKNFDPEPISVTGYKADSCSLNIGGEAVNGAIAAAKLGMKTSIMCHLGRDAAGDIIIRELEKYNVDTSLVIRSDEYATPITTMFVADDGSRKSITNGAHRYNFHPEKYVNSIKGTKAIVLGSLLRAPFDDPAVIRGVCGFAHENGILVFADTKLPNFSKLTLDDISDSLPLIDYITPNEDEAHYCTGQIDPNLMADAFIGKNARNVIIKLGSKGCFFRNEKEIFQLPAHEIDAVDATGAGDNFLAGFATEILRGRSHEYALMFANACGAICTTAVGAGTALEDREQVECFLKKEINSENDNRKTEK